MGIRVCVGCAGCDYYVLTSFYFSKQPIHASKQSIKFIPGDGVYVPFKAEWGEAVLFWGNQCSHYSTSNTADTTRVSLDFRVRNEETKRRRRDEEETKRRRRVEKNVDE